MKPSNRHIHILLGSMAVALVAFDTMAQQPQSAQQQSTSSAIIRRAREDARNDARKTHPELQSVCSSSMKNRHAVMPMHNG